MPDPSGQRQSAIAAVLIIVAASSFFTAAADEKSASHVAAEFGGYPGGGSNEPLSLSIGKCDRNRRQTTSSDDNRGLDLANITNYLARQ